MLTGDNQRTADAIGSRPVGRVIAGVLLTGADLASRRPLTVGDGINDALRP